MANVKTITATTTESAVEFNATYQFMWFRNFGGERLLHLRTQWHSC